MDNQTGGNISEIPRGTRQPVCRTERQGKKATYAERALKLYKGFHLGIQQSTNHYVCVKGPPERGRSHLEDLEVTAACTHGLEIVPAFSIQAQRLGI